MENKMTVVDNVYNNNEVLAYQRLTQALVDNFYVTSVCKTHEHLQSEN